MSKENYIEETRPHDSAYKHVSGYAEYTDDINEPNNTIYGAIGLSKKAHAIIKNIDLTEVKKYLEKDLSPIGDMRASKEYRLEIAKNLLMKCFVEINSNKLSRIN